MTLELVWNARELPNLLHLIDTALCAPEHVVDPCAIAFATEFRQRRRRPWPSELWRAARLGSACCESADAWLAQLQQQGPAARHAGQSAPANVAMTAIVPAGDDAGWLAWPAEVQRELGHARHGLQQHRPGWAEELRLRTQPLREQWLARGPGMVRWLQRRYDLTLPGRINVWSLLPLRGGFGVLVPGTNDVLLELLLTNLDDRLPELARLAWLVAQQMLAPQLQSSGRASTLTCQLAALLGMQAVATELEWFDMTPATLQRALVAWQIASGAETGRLGEPLANLQPSQLQTTADLFTWADHLAQFVAPR